MHRHQLKPRERSRLPPTYRRGHANHQDARRYLTFADMGVGSVKAAAIVATSRTVKRAKLAIGTLAAPPTTPKILVSAWSFAMEPGMLIAVVPRNLGSVSERAISSAMVEMALAARSVVSDAFVQWHRGDNLARVRLGQHGEAGMSIFPYAFVLYVCKRTGPRRVSD